MAARNWRLADRWPTAFGLILAAGAIAAIVFLDEDGDRFAPGVATMAGIYLVAFALAGIGWFAHGLWDAYHFRANRIVNRPWSEACVVVDIPVGIALLISAIAG